MADFEMTDITSSTRILSQYDLKPCWPSFKTYSSAYQVQQILNIVTASNFMHMIADVYMHLHLAA